MARYTKPIKTRLPKEKRILPMTGKDGKWFYCWNCGFPCKIDRDDSSGTPPGDGHTDVTLPATGYVENGPEDRIISLETPSNVHVLMELDANGDEQVIVHSHQSKIERGCPFCGTTNYA